MADTPGVPEASRAARTCEAACAHTPSSPHRPPGAWASSKAPVSGNSCSCTARSLRPLSWRCPAPGLQLAPPGWGAGSAQGAGRGPSSPPGTDPTHKVDFTLPGSHLAAQPRLHLGRVDGPPGVSAARNTHPHLDSKTRLNPQLGQNFLGCSLLRDGGGGQNRLLPFRPSGLHRLPQAPPSLNPPFCQGGSRPGPGV